MVSVVLSHVIGTITLLFIFVSIVTYSSLTYSTLGSRVMDYNLQEVSGHVASEIIDLVSLSSVTSEDQMLVKALQVPNDIRGTHYTISITHSGDDLIISSRQISTATVYGISPLPWSAEGSVQPFNGTDPGIGYAGVSPKLSVASSVGGLVLWCVKSGGVFTFGLGVMNTTQGA